MTTCGARAARDAADTQRPAQAGLPASCRGLARLAVALALRRAGAAALLAPRRTGAKPPSARSRYSAPRVVAALRSSVRLRCGGCATFNRQQPVRGVLMSFVGETVPTSPENALMPAASILTRCCPGRSSEQYYTDDMPRRFVFIRRSRVPRARVTLARRGRGTRTTAAVT